MNPMRRLQLSPRFEVLILMEVVGGVVVVLVVVGVVVVLVVVVVVVVRGLVDPCIEQSGGVSFHHSCSRVYWTSCVEVEEGKYSMNPMRAPCHEVLASSTILKVYGLLKISTIQAVCKGDHEAKGQMEVVVAVPML